MKHCLFLFLALTGLITGCARESLILDAAADSRQPFVQTNQLPSYTEPELQALIANSDSEEMLAAKTELLAFALTKFLGEHSGLQNNSNLSAHLPCDVGLTNPDGILRTLGEASGLETGAVENHLNDYILDCPGGCSNVPEGFSGYFTATAHQLDYQGAKYEVFARYQENSSFTLQPELFLGYAPVWDGSQYMVRGFRYLLTDDVLTKEDISAGDFIDLNGAWIEVWDEILPRENDPCYYIYNGPSGGGSGSGGGGGGTTNTDDDGSAKNSFTGPLSLPPYGYEGTMCSGPTGLRVTEFHISRRNEGGWFGGDSEVHFNVSFYNTGNPSFTLQTNSRSSETDPMIIAGNKYYLERGKLLAEVPPNQISSSLNTVITENSGFTDGGDWILIDSGFCNGATNNTYNQVYVSAFERDPKPIIFGTYYGFVLYDSLMQQFGNVDAWQPLYMPNESDKWMRITLNHSDFASQNHIYLVDAGNDSTYISLTEPNPDKSWFHIEIFQP